MRRTLCERCGRAIADGEPHTRVREDGMSVLAPSGDDRFQHFCKKCWSDILEDGWSDGGREPPSLHQTVPETMFGGPLRRDAWAFATAILGASHVVNPLPIPEPAWDVMVFATVALTITTLLERLYGRVAK
jgi:hypothetical protein